MRTRVLLLACALGISAGFGFPNGARQTTEPPGAAASSPSDIPHGPALVDAQRLFYNARYDAAAAAALELRAADPEDLATYELRTSALLFQIKSTLADAPDMNDAFKRCAPCQPVMAAFLSDVARGRALARARLAADPHDEDALFFLGKVDLNYVWMQLGTLGRKTGWNEYREARRSLQAVLKRNPRHVRARVAYAWIEYIVDTKVPFGVKWLLGGGDRKRALRTVQEAAAADTDFFSHTEAVFGLWELQVRQKMVREAVGTARLIARDFPDNAEVAKFLGTHAAVP